jgi:hypothetical protein
VPVERLGDDAAELIGLSSGEAKSLSALAGMAVQQVPGCTAAYAALWRRGAPTGIAATHPDAAGLADFQLRTGNGPLITAAEKGVSLSCPDTLTETRWPDWSTEALWRGVRNTVNMTRQGPGVTMVLALLSVRPGVLAPGRVPMAAMLAELGSTVLVNNVAYDTAQRTATQLKDSVAARAVTDQAKGILMHALGCDAAEALAYLRRESQRRHVKVTEVAAQVIETHGGHRPKR